jgi:hypothetical protein
MFGVILVSWFLSFGYVPQLTESVEQTTTTLETQYIPTVAEIGLRADYHLLSVYGSVETYQYYFDTLSFAPFRADYKIGAELRIAEGITAVIEHECDHAVVSSRSGKSSNTYGSMNTKMVLRLSGSSK